MNRISSLLFGLLTLTSPALAQPSAIGDAPPAERSGLDRWAKVQVRAGDGVTHELEHLSLELTTTLVNKEQKTLTVSPELAEDVEGAIRGARPGEPADLYVDGKPYRSPNLAIVARTLHHSGLRNEVPHRVFLQGEKTGPRSFRLAAISWTSPSESWRELKFASRGLHGSYQRIPQGKHVSLQVYTWGAVLPRREGDGAHLTRRLSLVIDVAVELDGVVLLANHEQDPMSSTTRLVDVRGHQREVDSLERVSWVRDEDWEAHLARASKLLTSQEGATSRLRRASQEETGDRPQPSTCPTE